MPADLNITGNRLADEDGRLFLWAYYGDLLFRNPLGFGLGFDSIVDTNVGFQGIRLMPHNAILQAGMYAGYLGVGVTLYQILKVVGVISCIKQDLGSINLSSTLIGLALAWCTLVVNQMFTGLLNADFNFSILTALLLVKFLQHSSNPLKN